MDSKTEFKVGDVVALKSAPQIKLTVSHASTNGKSEIVKCYFWLNGQIEETLELPAAVFEKAD